MPRGKTNAPDRPPTLCPAYQATAQGPKLNATAQTLLIRAHGVQLPFLQGTEVAPVPGVRATAKSESGPLIKAKAGKGDRQGQHLLSAGRGLGTEEGPASQSRGPLSLEKMAQNACSPSPGLPSLRKHVLANMSSAPLSVTFPVCCPPASLLTPPLPGPLQGAGLVPSVENTCPQRPGPDPASCGARSRPRRRGHQPGSAWPSLAGSKWPGFSASWLPLPRRGSWSAGPWL